MPEARLGLFRDYGALESTLAIRIRRDARSQRWVAGSGKTPIQPRKAPELPLDAVRIPVGDR